MFYILYNENYYLEDHMLNALLDYNSKENQWLRAHPVKAMSVGFGLSIVIWSATAYSVRNDLK